MRVAVGGRRQLATFLRPPFFSQSVQFKLLSLCVCPLLLRPFCNGPFFEAGKKKTSPRRLENIIACSSRKTVKIGTDSSSVRLSRKVSNQA